ncbi:hypothetical protein BIV57_04250 [Mangrovactinospora gilvigrisea]|uniref:Uncharacterized protein n=1 Tax=Mangrovactinospora gilvigrisea TaxID=1428644 RepID=A0A1J7CGB9_9ACTN|nr:hypothetical protein BIV57_04250 [Mangrovactinospora gilvigrisea]
MNDSTPAGLAAQARDRIRAIGPGTADRSRDGCYRHPAEVAATLQALHGLAAELPRISTDGWAFLKEEDVRGRLAIAGRSVDLDEHLQRCEARLEEVRAGAEQLAGALARARSQLSCLVIRRDEEDDDLAEG